jgi:hypothetical protein
MEGENDHDIRRLGVQYLYRMRRVRCQRGPIHRHFERLSLSYAYTLRYLYRIGNTVRYSENRPRPFLTTSTHPTTPLSLAVPGKTGAILNSVVTNFLSYVKAWGTGTGSAFQNRHSAVRALVAERGQTGRLPRKALSSDVNSHPSGVLQRGSVASSR